MMNGVPRMLNTLKPTINASAPRVVRGVSLAHRKLTLHQKAVVLANILDGLTIYQPSEQDLVRLFGVSAQYIQNARRLTPDQRQVVLEYTARHPAISARPKPKPKNGNGHLDDSELFRTIANVGIDRALNVAAKVDQAQRARVRAMQR